jgi:hypothetical protein
MNTTTLQVTILLVQRKDSDRIFLIIPNMRKEDDITSATQKTSVLMQRKLSRKNVSVFQVTQCFKRAWNFSFSLE